MAPAPQITEGQSVVLDVGTSVPCRVIGFSGANVVLKLRAQPPDPVEAGQAGYVLLQGGGGLHALRGTVVAPTTDEVVMHLGDDVPLGQRRLFSRAPLALPATLTRTDDGRSWTTTTRDISAGGAAVQRAGAEPGRDGFELCLEVSNHRVRSRVEVVRATPDELGLRFAGIARDDELLLASLALAYHRLG